MGHRFAIIVVVGIIGAIGVLNAILDFMEAQFGIWFALPVTLLILGFVYLLVYESSELTPREAEG